MSTVHFDDLELYIVLDRAPDTGRIGITAVDGEACIYRNRMVADLMAQELREDGWDVAVIHESHIQAALNAAWALVREGN